MSSVAQALSRAQIDDADVVAFVEHLLEESESRKDFVDALKELDLSEQVARDIWSAAHAATISTASAPTGLEDEDDDEEMEYFKRMANVSSKTSSEKVDVWKQLDTLVEGAVYKGTVRGIQPYGCFVELPGVKSSGSNNKNIQGLCHISKLANRRVESAEEVVSQGQTVFVKLEQISGNKLSLSMKSVDQLTGKVLSSSASGKRTHDSTGANSVPLGRREASSSKSVLPMDYKPDDDAKTKRRKTKDKTDHERYEEAQLVKAGIIKRAYDPADDDSFNERNETGEAVEVELKSSLPPFLQEHSSSLMSYDAEVKVVASVEGSMSRAAAAQGEYSRDRREERRQKREEEEENDDDDEPDFSNLQKKRVAPPRSFDPRRVTKEPTLADKQVKSMKEQRESLPIFKLKSQLVQALENHQILVVIGETGSGKTTQMTQYFDEMGITKHGIIGCTQPRRVAATSIAKRVADEHGSVCGDYVGYTIRFDDKTSPNTKIKYMTDGMLMREYLMDSKLSRYSCLVLDEAHERTVQTDVLFGLLKNLSRIRKDLKLVITSATLDAERFSSYFFDAPIFTIPGRTFPVEILYAKQPEMDYVDCALTTALTIHANEPPGDILIFLTGQEEIESACELLFERSKALQNDCGELIVLPVYGQLPSEMQSRIFEPAPSGARKVVVATNIAEASLTIDGIYYVIDPGFTKQKVYNPKLSMDSLVVVPCSRASANQRAGRAGRTGPGKCFRLYTEQAFTNEMLPTSVPELQRTNLGSVVLQLKAMGIENLLDFDFLDPPPKVSLVSAMEELYALGCLSDQGRLTKTGRRMAEFPLSPVLAKTLLTSVALGCSVETLIVVSMLSVENAFYRPRDKQREADQKHRRFFQPEGDHLTLLNVYQAWERANFSNQFCLDNYIQARTMRRARDVRKQLEGIVQRFKLAMIACGKDLDRVRKAFVAGHFRNTAKRDPSEGYRTLVDDTPCFLHPSSSLFGRRPEWVLYAEMTLTTREYLRNVTKIEPEWLYEFAPRFFSKADPTKLTKRKKAEKIQPLYNRHDPDQLWRMSNRPS